MNNQNKVPNRNRRIALLIPYFGKWPKYFNFFLNSVSYNRDLLDVFLISDINWEQSNHISLPSNVTLHKMSLAEIKLRLDDIIEFKTSINSPYKLCDLKPMYGHIFKDLIFGYSHWAFGDIDVIFGRVSSFITPQLLDSFEILRFREKWMSGAFTVIKNQDNLRTLYLEGNKKDLEKILRNPEYCGFDEVSLDWSIGNKDIEDIDFKLDNFTRIVHERSKTDLKLYKADLLHEKISGDDYIFFNKGGVFDSKGKEYLAYHWVINKRSPFFYYHENKHVPSNFMVYDVGFVMTLGILKKFIVLKRRFIRFTFRCINFLQRQFNEK